MKKLMIFLLVLCTAVCLCACGEEQETSDTASSAAAVSSTVESSAAERSENDEDVSETSSADIALATFEVTVVDENGTPVPGVMLQVCKDTCFPAVTGDDGVAVFNVEITDGYKLSVMSCPSGYSYNGEETVYLESGISEYTLTVQVSAE